MRLIYVICDRAVVVFWNALRLHSLNGNAGTIGKNQSFRSLKGDY